MKGGSTTVQQTIDPQTQAYVNQLRQSALASQGNPIYGQARQLGGLGLSALGGDQQALSGLMNPYSQTLDPYWQQLRGTTLSTIGQQATQSGAYGGSRQGVAEGQALGDIANAQAGQRYGEYTQAMGRAGQLANLGLGVDPQILQMLAGSIGPYGQTKTITEQTPWWQQALGVGLTAGGFLLGGPAGAAAGAGAANQFGGQSGGGETDKAQFLPQWSGQAGPSPWGGRW